MRRGRGVLFSLLGLALVAVPGFAIGLFAGVLWEDPGLILGDMAGGTEDVAWGPLPPPDAAAPAPEGQAEAPQAGGVAAAPEEAPRAVSAPPPPDAAAPLPSATKASVAVTARPGGRFSVQVGAFAESQAAEELANSLRSSGLLVYVSPSAAAAGDQRWRVRVGPYATREAADEIAARLKTREKLPTWVLSEDGA